MMVFRKSAENNALIKSQLSKRWSNWKILLICIIMNFSRNLIFVSEIFRFEIGTFKIENKLQMRNAQYLVLYSSRHVPSKLFM